MLDGESLMKTRTSFLFPIVLLIIAFANSQDKTTGPLIFGTSASTWKMEFPARDYLIISNDSSQDGKRRTLILRNTERKLSVTLKVEPADGRKTSIECRDFHLAQPNRLIDSQSLRVYEKEGVPFSESKIKAVTGYSGRFVQAFYLKDGYEFSVLVYVSAFDEANDRPVCNAIFRSINFAYHVDKQ